VLQAGVEEKQPRHLGGVLESSSSREVRKISSRHEMLTSLRRPIKSLG